MKAKTIKPETEKSDLEKFVSPLERYVRDNCEKCGDWTRRKCELYTEMGTTRVALCMTAAALLQDVGSTDPAEILQEAKQALSELFKPDGE